MGFHVRMDLYAEDGTKNPPEKPLNTLLQDRGWAVMTRTFNDHAGSGFYQSVSVVHTDSKNLVAAAWGGEDSWNLFLTIKISSSKDKGIPQPTRTLEKTTRLIFALFQRSMNQMM